MSAAAALFIALLLVMMGVVVAFYFWTKYDTLRRKLGRNFVDALMKGRSGLIVGLIKEHILEFDFLPSSKMDEHGFYEVTIKSSDGEEIGHRKIAAEDVFFINGKIPIAFIMNSKIRAFNLEQLKVLDAADINRAVDELMQDYHTYYSLSEAVKALSSQMTFITDVEKAQKVREEIERNRQVMEAIKKKWGLVIVELVEGRDIVIYDNEHAYLVRPVNFSKFAEVTTGASPTTISKMARDKFQRWATKFMEDVIKIFKVPGLNQPKLSGSGMSTLMMAVLLIIGIVLAIMIARGG